MGDGRIVFEVVPVLVISDCVSELLEKKKKKKKKDPLQTESTGEASICVTPRKVIEHYVVHHQKRRLVDELVEFCGPSKLAV